MTRGGAAGRAASFIAVAVIAWLVFDAVVRPASGPLAIANILSTFLVVGTILIVAVAAIRGGRLPRVALIGLVVVVALRFGDEWISPPAAEPPGPTVDVATWNLEFGAVGVETMREGLTSLDVDIVAVHELTREQVAAIEGDPTLIARFPYRALFPAAGAGVEGIGLLSRLPLSGIQSYQDPVRVSATALIDGREVAVLAAHPFPGGIRTVSAIRLPIGFDPTVRNGELATIHRQVEELLETGEVIVLGDFNTAPTEPGYALLTSGLTDAHVAVGQGPGWSWRPSRLEFLGIGLLRIDLVLTSPGIEPVRSWVDCSRPGDHCLVGATLSSAPQSP